MTLAALGLSANDFDAYLPERASSNAFSRPRLEFKQRALAWARGVTARLAQLGIAVDVHGSDEHPSLWNHHRVDCQWVFFWSQADERADIDALLDLRRGIAQTVRDPSPAFRHAFLALRVDSEGVEICVQVHPDAWLDFETVAARLHDGARAVSLVGALSKLPDEFGFGVGRELFAPCETATVDSLLDALGQARQRPEALWVGWRIPRAVAVEHTALLDEQLEDAIVALAPLYRELSWRADDDPAGLRGQLDQMRSDTQRHVAERVAQDERRKAEDEALRVETTEKSRERTREKVDYAARPNVTLANLFKSDSPAAAPAPARQPRAPHPQRPAPSPGKPAAAPAEPREPAASRRPPREKAGSSRPSPRRDAPVVETPRDFRDAELVDDPDGVLDKGAKVRVNSGPFAGKVGVVGELDGRGGARVLLGLLSTRLAVAELSVLAEARDRPPMHSSHRHPPLRSGK